MVRVHRPEQHQLVWLLLDCGRHMAGVVAGREKLDAAADAAMRLSRVALEAGDLVGLVAFGAKVKAHVAADKSAAQARLLAHALSQLQASLEESDYLLAIETAFARHRRRSLVVLLTDVLAPRASEPVLASMRRLTPRHLPLVLSLFDEGVAAVARAEPTTRQQAHERRVAAILEAEGRAAATRLHAAGARLVRASASSLSAAGVSAYLELKHQGRL